IGRSLGSNPARQPNFVEALLTPQDLGCNCSECPLKDRKPVVPPQVRDPKPRRLAIVSDYPGEEETKKSAFFVGPTGDLLKRRFISFLKIPLKEVHLTNAL